MDWTDMLLRSFTSGGFWVAAVIAALLIFIIWRSYWTIGPTEVGLVRKRFGSGKLAEAIRRVQRRSRLSGQLMMPGIQFKLWPLYDVTRHPMVQIPAGQIGVVIAQVGASLPVGAKSGIYKPEFGNFQDLRTFVDKAAARKACSVSCCRRARRAHPSGRLPRRSPRDTVYGVPIDEKYARWSARAALKPEILRPRAGAAGSRAHRAALLSGRQGRRHDRHRHDLRRSAAAQGRHRQSHRRFRRSRPQLESRPRHQGQRPRRSDPLGRRTRTTTTTRTSRRSSITADASACSTIR